MEEKIKNILKDKLKMKNISKEINDYNSTNYEIIINSLLNLLPDENKVNLSIKIEIKLEKIIFKYANKLLNDPYDKIVNDDNEYNIFLLYEKRKKDEEINFKIEDFIEVLPIYLINKYESINSININNTIKKSNYKYSIQYSILEQQIYKFNYIVNNINDIFQNDEKQYLTYIEEDYILISPILENNNKYIYIKPYIKKLDKYPFYINLINKDVDQKNLINSINLSTISLIKFFKDNSNENLSLLSEEINWMNELENFIQKEINKAEFFIEDNKNIINKEKDLNSNIINNNISKMVIINSNIENLNEENDILNNIMNLFNKNNNNYDLTHNKIENYLNKDEIIQVIENREKFNRETSILGEKIVFEFLKKKRNLHDVEWINNEKEKGDPYDIKAKDINKNRTIYFEVKSTANNIKKSDKSPIHITNNQWNFMQNLNPNDRYYIGRVFDVRSDCPTIEFIKYKKSDYLFD